jgi:ABC-2 type transport system ATP-binding protein
LRPALEAEGATVTDADGALEVSGLPIERVGELAAQQGVILHELRTQAHTLEQAFLSLTEPQGDDGATPALPDAPPRSDR